MNVEIKKFSYPIPIFWLDTNVIIDIARARLGLEKDQTKIDQTDKIFNLIFQLTQQNKILCPKGDQYDEFANNLITAKECEKVMNELSMGIQLWPSDQTEKFQIQKMMNLYCGKSNDFRLESEDIFYGDPLTPIQNSRNRGLYVTVNRMSDGTDIDHRLYLRDSLVGEYERIRSETKTSIISFDQQLDKEFLAEGEVIKGVFENLTYKERNGISFTEEEINQGMMVAELLAIWKRIAGEQSTFEDMLSFYKSAEYRAIPYVEIRSNLFASIVTERQRIAKKGDHMDVKQVSAILPYADYVLTDADLKNRIGKLKFGKYIKAKIWSLKDAANILIELTLLTN